MWPFVYVALRGDCITHEFVYQVLPFLARIENIKKLERTRGKANENRER